MVKGTYNLDADPGIAKMADVPFNKSRPDQIGH